MSFMNFLTFLPLLLFTTCLLSAPISNQSQQIDAVLLDELLRDIVDSSMSELRHRLQEAVFAAAFRRRIQNLNQKEAKPSGLGSIHRILDDYISRSDLSIVKDQKLSIALETFTTTVPPTVSTVSNPIKLITAAQVELDENHLQHNGRMFDDAENEPLKITSSRLPRVPSWIAIIVCIVCLVCFLLFVGSLVFHMSKRSRRKREIQLATRQMPDPLTVAGICHSSDCISAPMPISSRRSSFVMDQDRSGSVIWTTA